MEANSFYSQSGLRDFLRLVIDPNLFGNTFVMTDTKVFRNCPLKPIRIHESNGHNLNQNVAKNR